MNKKQTNRKISAKKIKWRKFATWQNKREERNTVSFTRTNENSIHSVKKSIKKIVANEGKENGLQLLYDQQYVATVIGIIGGQLCVVKLIATQKITTNDGMCVQQVFGMLIDSFICISSNDAIFAAIDTNTVFFRSERLIIKPK